MVSKVRPLLAWILILLISTGCGSIPIQLETASIGDVTLKKQALGTIFNSPTTKNAIAAIKRSGITIQWSNPIYGGGKKFGRGEITCIVVSCKFYSMVGKVNQNTNMIVGFYVARTDYGTKMWIAGGQVIQRRALSSSRTQISGVDLLHKQAAYAEVDVPINNLRASSVTGATTRLAAIGPIKGYQNLGQLLTVSTSGGLSTAGGTPVLPCYRYNSDVTPSCGGGGGGPVTPAPPVPEPGPDCEEVDCREKRRAARAGAWKVVGGYATGGAAVAVATTACVGSLGTGCQVAIIGAIAGVATGGALFLEGENAKETYEECLEDQLLSDC